MSRNRATSIGVSALTAFAGFVHVAPAWAQDAPPADDGPVKGEFYAQGDIKPEESLKKSAVESTLSIGATLSINDTQSWIGQTDGSTINFGFKLEAMVDVYEQRHEWRHALFIGEGLTQTPLVDELVKTRDVATYETLYLFYVNDWFGPFARFGAQTALFRGQDVRPGEVTYQVARIDGTSDQILGQRLTLTDPFQPLTLKQSIGPFVRPVREEAINVELRAGLGARETFATGQLALTDDVETEAVEVTELRDVMQIGAEGALQIWGTLEDSRILYKLRAEALTPFAYTDLLPGDERTAFDLTNIELGATVGVKIFEWASLDYEFRAVREPLLLDAFQYQNNLLLTFGLTVTNKPKEEDATPPPLPPPPDPEPAQVPPAPAVVAEPVPAAPAPIPDAPAPAPIPAPAPPAPAPADPATP